MQRIVRIVVTILGFVFGAGLASYLLGQAWLPEILPFALTTTAELAAYIILILLFGLIFFLLYPRLLAGIQNLTKEIEANMEGVRLSDIILSVSGLIIGLVIAMLISFAFIRIPFEWLSSTLTFGVYVLFGYLGFVLPMRKRDDILNGIQSLNFGKKDKDTTAAPKKTSGRKKGETTAPKILDTSAVIDGRIYDIAQAGFIEGPLVVPVFVLNELQLVADSSDDLKRNRGRRGLDVINRMQTDLDITVQISEVDYDDIAEVDTKLIRLAKEMDGKILTNDYNLNKVATVQGIDVLNINELANAVKPIVLPGEEMNVQLVKAGKEASQAVAYLDDGTMIVVENGRRHLNEQLPVIVTSILQTAAGRMIFAKPKGH